MVTLRNSYRLSVVSQGYCSCKDKNNDPKCTCTHTCMGGLSLRGTQQVGSLHRKGWRITHRCPLETVTHLAMGWRHSVLGSLLECIPAPGGGFPWQNCCSKENGTWFLSEASMYNPVSLGLVIVHSHGPESSLGRGPSLAGGPVCWPRGFALLIPSTARGRKREEEM